MLLQISILKKLDVYRDGGSLSASFESKEKIEYCLFFVNKINSKYTDLSDWNEYEY